MVATVVEAAAGRVPVMAGATSNDTAPRRRRDPANVRASASTASSRATPYYNKPTQGGLARHFRAVADASTRPVCLYNVPGRTGVNLAARHRAPRWPSIRTSSGIKEASGDLRQIMEILRHRPEGFAVLSGDDWLAFPVVAAGGDGLISVVSNEVPARDDRAGPPRAAGELEAARAMAVPPAAAHGRQFPRDQPSPVKAALALMGRIRDVLRLPLVPARPATRAALRRALQRRRGVHVR